MNPSLSEFWDTGFYTPPQNVVLKGYTVFSLSVILSFHDHFKVLLCKFSSSCPILFKFSPHLNYQTLHVFEENGQYCKVCHFVILTARCLP